MDESEEPTSHPFSTFDNRIVYSLPTRLGFWNDDLALREELFLITSHKKERCELLIQKTRRMLRNLLRPVKLANEGNFVTFGETYQIRAHDIENALNEDNKSLFISGLISDQEIDHSQHFQHGSLVTASSYKSPCVRNTFKLIGTGSYHTEGGQVPYGEDVLIQISESGSNPLYIKCNNVNTETVGNFMSLSLSETPNIYCRFKFYPWNPQHRVKLKWTPFMPFSRVIIQHTASGKNLILRTNEVIPTFFGPEYLLSCHTLLDSHKMETPENFWTIVCKKVISRNDLVRATKGESASLDE